MTHPNEAPAAAWYPDPQTSGQVRWWDGTNWTEHVSTPVASAAVQAAVAHTVAEQLAAAPITATDEAFAAVTHIGRHAAGSEPAPRQPATAPRFRPRERVEVTVEAGVSAFQYA